MSLGLYCVNTVYMFTYVRSKQYKDSATALVVSKYNSSYNASKKTWCLRTMGPQATSRSWSSLPSSASDSCETYALLL